MSDLKPCPFCGKEACYVDDAGQAVEFSDKASCGNSDCMPYETYVEVAAWQTRPIEDALLARAEAAERELSDTQKRLEDAIGEIKHLKDTRQKPWDEIECQRARADKAERELAELRERTRWVPVSERLPENNKTVLFYDSLNHIVHSGYHTGYPQWTSKSGLYYREAEYNRITHWQPRPEPPEAE